MFRRLLAGASLLALTACAQGTHTPAGSVAVADFGSDVQPAARDRHQKRGAVRYGATAAATSANPRPDWCSYSATGNVACIQTATAVASAIGERVYANGGYSSGQTLSSPIANGGSFDGNQTVGNVGSVLRTLSAHLNDQTNILDYGAVAGTADSSTALGVAMAAAQANGSVVTIPYSTSGYMLGTAGSYTVKTPGEWDFRGNVISGPGIGTPNTGGGTLLSPYTNPWLITSNRKRIYDPAAIPQLGNETTTADSLECKPNRANPLNANTARNWITCRYVGADTGSGGTSSTDISTEIENWVLNVSGNHGVGFEIDTNFNAAVTDGQWTTGLFLTGGGPAGTNVNSVALSIMHAAYDGTDLPWTTGISIRQATTMLEFQNTQAGETGYFQRGYDSAGNTLWSVDKAGNLVSAGGATLGSFLHAPSITINGTTFSTLATCSSSTLGQERTVTDSAVNTWGTTVTGGGTYSILAYCDGANWTVAAK